MEIRFMVRSLAAVAVSAALAAPALADTVQLTSYTHGGPSTVSVGTPNYSGGAGQFSGTLNSNSFDTFCVEIGQTFGLGATYNNYSVVAGTLAWGAGKATALNQLMSYAASNLLPSNQDNSAALQSAVWEVINETSSSYGFTTGSFKASSGTASTQLALTTLDGIWANLGTQTITRHVDQLHSDTNQDFLVMAPVPEPETYAMLLAGLGIVGAVARRRRSAEA